MDLPKKDLCAILHTIAHKIACMIMKITMYMKESMECTNKFHMECVWWMMDEGQTGSQLSD